MSKKFATLGFIFLLSATLCGCIAVMGYMADTAKAKAEIDISYSDSVNIVKGAMKIQGVQFEKAAIEKEVMVVKGTDTEGRTVRIYIQKVSDTRCAFSVRVGMTEAGKASAEQILQAIIDYSKDVAGASAQQE